MRKLDRAIATIPACLASYAHGRHAGLDETTTLWRNGHLVFALCDRCASCHDVVFSPTEAGVEVRAKRRAPLVLGGGL